MFNNKFFQYSDNARYLELDPGSPLSRHNKFWQFVAIALEWFELNPSLTEVKITAVANVETEKNPFHARVFHHFSLTTIGTPCPVTDVNTFAVKSLPFSEIGNGSFTMRRDDLDVQAFLALVANPASEFELSLEYKSLVAKLGFQMDRAFGDSYVVHDVGIPNYD